MNRSNGSNGQESSLTFGIAGSVIARQAQCDSFRCCKSKPFETVDPENQQTVYKVIKLTKKIESHKANLQNDYQTLADMYLAKKKEQVLEEWIATRQSETYIRIDDTYANCNFDFDNWIK